MAFDKLTLKSQEALHAAFDEARRGGNPEITPEHVLLALLAQEGGIVPQILRRAGAAVDDLEAVLRQHLGRLPRQEGGSDPRLSRRVQEALRAAETIAGKNGEEYVSTEHLLLALLEEKHSDAATLLRSHGADRQALTEAISTHKGTQKASDPTPEGRYGALEKYTSDLTRRAREGKIDPVIGRDDEIRRVMQVLSRRTKNNPVLIGAPGVGKTAIAEGLARRIVAGDVPEALRAARLLALDLGLVLAGTKFRGEFEERMKALLKEIEAGRGEIILFIDELHTIVGAGAVEGQADAANLLKPALARGDLRCIGATTLDEYRKHVEKDKALERRFQPVYVDEPGFEESVAILRGLKERYEVHHGVRIQDAALVAAVRLSLRYLPERQLPDKAIDLIDEAASRLRLEIDSVPQVLDDVMRQRSRLEMERFALEKERDRASRERLTTLEEELANLKEEERRLRNQWQGERDQIQAVRTLKGEMETLRERQVLLERQGQLEEAARLRYQEIPQLERRLNAAEAAVAEGASPRLLQEEVDEESIAAIVSRWTGIPVSRMLQSEGERLLRMEEALAERVVGQSEALRVVSDALRRSRAGLAEGTRPLGSFLFVGPTGVGKTELARALAAFLFDDERALVRIDMSEYGERHSVARLIGAPPGYVGYDEGGQLTEVIRRRPYAVVLLDEVEKAHPEVFHTLLQVLDDGRLTDGQGRTVDFTNVVLILTSNLGSEVLTRADLSDEEIEDRARESVSGFFRPEFLNRIDDVVVFRRLRREDMRRIVDIQVARLAKRLAERDITLHVSEETRDRLAAEGYDPVFGARPLKRLIEREIANPIARQILEGKIGAGDQAVAEMSDSS